MFLWFESNSNCTCKCVSVIHSNVPAQWDYVSMLYSHHSLICLWSSTYMEFLSVLWVHEVCFSLRPLFFLFNVPGIFFLLFFTRSLLHIQVSSLGDLSLPPFWSIFHLSLSPYPFPRCPGLCVWQSLTLTEIILIFTYPDYHLFLPTEGK